MAAFHFLEKKPLFLKDLNERNLKFFPTAPAQSAFFPPESCNCLPTKITDYVFLCTRQVSHKLVPAEVWDSTAHTLLTWPWRNAGLAFI